MLEDQTQTSSVNDIVQINYIEDKKFSGIISYLLEKNNDGNLKLTGGDNYQYGLSNLLLLDICYIDQGYYCFTYDRKSAWIEYDFGDKKIDMTSYTIRSLGRFQCQYQPKTWKFMGSNDHEKWEMIDFKDYNDELNKGCFVGHFECSRKGKFYRYIKYIQLNNWSPCGSRRENKLSKYIISLSSIEFFGSISF